jgi:methyltransferase (TIGR00027 family)
LYLDRAGPQFREIVRPARVSCASRRPRFKLRGMLTVADTAYSIAVIRAEEAELPLDERLFEDPYASTFAAAGAHAAEGTKRYLDLPFFSDYIRLRTRFIDDRVREALSAGLNQIVILGAGFDTRGLRLPEIAAHGAATFEIDFEEQLARKREILLATGVALPASIAYVGCDFNAVDYESALTSSLEARGFRTGERALFICEGVLEYLANEAIDPSLRFMARLGGPGSRLVFTFGLGRFDPETPLGRLQRNGFTACDETGYNAIARRYWSTEPFAHEEVARIGCATV